MSVYQKQKRCKLTDAICCAFLQIDGKKRIFCEIKVIAPAANPRRCCAAQRASSARQACAPRRLHPAAARA